MWRVLDWIDRLFGGDRRGVRALLVCLAIVPAAILIESCLNNPDWPIEAIRNDPRPTPLPTLTIEEIDRIADRILEETFREVTVPPPPVRP